jgi:hypothetical protein
MPASARFGLGEQLGAVQRSRLASPSGEKIVT